MSAAAGSSMPSSFASAILSLLESLMGILAVMENAADEGTFGGVLARSQASQPHSCFTRDPYRLLENDDYSIVVRRLPVPELKSNATSRILPEADI